MKNSSQVFGPIIDTIVSMIPSSFSGNEANSDEDVFAWMATGAALGKAEKGICVSALARSVWLSYSISRPISLPSGSLHCSIYLT